ncbi:hypothetical protein M406DRAFT_69114 [Cryphonectria parasitica EP155]|uniref:Uncharacterized protein n=1 Tax=Cryphonectria parasitica (strain ATCC 38755 / EP155) TaxID=660469 RepID=A0A9P5CQX8_CRYP1|nr:uncharacterized protein M406DRAFT_69114 [Cryphonectria parasitica EP155]KAF3766937.1 hypothetical protein M406DRAFT_69114 [Cryphonectria parasitica EP155]
MSAASPEGSPAPETSSSSEDFGFLFDIADDFPLPQGVYDFLPDPATDPINPFFPSTPSTGSSTTSSGYLQNPGAPDQGHGDDDDDNDDGGLQDPRPRQWDSLYDLNQLVTQPGVYPGPSQPLGMLQKEWRAKFEQNNNGSWNYVEYVPAWTDPEWSERYVYIQDAEPADDDPRTRIYAKPGMLQKLRPALLPSDAQHRPTAEAKRWGFNPYPSHYNLGTTHLNNTNDPSGHSGVTPTAARFPDVPVSVPQGADGDRATLYHVNLKDLAAHRAKYDQSCVARGTQPTDGAFIQFLLNIWKNDPVPAKAALAEALLALWEMNIKKMETNEYQRMLFQGNTSQELIDQNIWTLGKGATNDLAEPLHDLITQDKWVITQDRGNYLDEPRLVYNISGKQGEFTAHNPVLWAALQPTLQLVSKVLASDHPMTWAWADVRKLRPIHDARKNSKRFSRDSLIQAQREAGISKTRRVALWPHRGEPGDELSGRELAWDELVQIYEKGFDTTRYACEILRRTIEWDIQPQYRFKPGEPDVENSASGGTTVRRVQDGPVPFKIIITVAAEYVWQLLVDDYSAAEKASVSFHLASVMLHEIAHALNNARLQMSGPPREGGNGQIQKPPLWLELNPDWQRKVDEFNAENSCDIVSLLRRHGLRFKLHRVLFERRRIVWNMEELFVENEPIEEEGWSTENKYFGGVVGTLASSLGSIPTMKAPRFLAEMALMPSFRHWPTAPGTQLRFLIHSPLPTQSYLRYFSQTFWNSEVSRFGAEALKFPPQLVSGTLDWYVFKWKHVRQHFGQAASEWIKKAWSRLKKTADCQILWRWLYFRTFAAADAQSAHHMWYFSREDWFSVDVSVWGNWKAVERAFDAMQKEIQENAPEDDKNPFTYEVNPPKSEIRAFIQAVTQALAVLNREASFNQIFVLHYQRLEEGPVKEGIFNKYSSSMRRRMLFYSDEVIMAILRCLTFTEQGKIPLQTWKWLTRDTDISWCFAKQIPDLLSKFRTCWDFYNVTWSLFSQNPRIRQAAQKRRLGAIPSAAVNSMAERLRTVAMHQYFGLHIQDVRRRIADQWKEILEHGEALRNPAPGSQAERINNDCAARNRAIEETLAAEERAIDMKYGDEPEPAEVADAGLQEDQPLAEDLSRSRDFSREEEVIFASLSGYRPYKDAKTGFTKFQNVRNQMSDGQWNAMEGGAPPSSAVPAPDADPTAFVDDLETRMAYLASQLREQERSGMGDLSGLPEDRDMLFGADATARGQAIQKVEDMVRQRTAAQSLIDPPQDEAQSNPQGSDAAGPSSVSRPDAAVLEAFGRRARSDFSETAPDQFRFWSWSNPDCHELEPPVNSNWGSCLFVTMVVRAVFDHVLSIIAQLGD